MTEFRRKFDENHPSHEGKWVFSLSLQRGSAPRFNGAPNCLLYFLIIPITLFVDNKKRYKRQDKQINDRGEQSMSKKKSFNSFKDFGTAFKSGALDKGFYASVTDNNNKQNKEQKESIDNFNKFVKSLEVSEEAEVEATIPTIFTLAFKIKEIEQNAERNISVRINENMELITKNSVEEIQQAIDFLSAKLENPIASETFTSLDIES